MDKKLAPIVEKLVKEFEAQVNEQHSQVDLLLQPAQLPEACTRLKELGFELLSAMSAVDYFPQEAPRFHVFYHFISVSKNLRLGLRLPVPGINPVIPTISHIYHNANWRERELWDMFGIKAEGHPDLRRILMPADWEGHPLRKDYPLGYEEVQFTFNFDEINRRKPYAKE
jgi:NADH-quinone oxidoreductase subunit C